MKKAAAVLALVLSLVLVLAACGGGGSSTSTAEESAGGGAAAESEAEGGGGEAEAGGGAEAEGGTAGTSSEIAIEANPSGALEFEEEEVNAKAGKDTVDFTNQSSEAHNVTIETSSGEVIGETETFAEGSGSAAVELEPGTYTFFCSVPGHREAGMEGTLVVK